jgi:hypothetical protein
VVGGKSQRETFCLTVFGVSGRVMQRELICALLPDRLDEADATLSQDALDAANGVPFGIQQEPDAAEQVDIVGPVIAAAAAALHRLDLSETALPKPENMLRHVEVVGDLADRAERIWGLVENGLISFERGRLSSPSAAADPDKCRKQPGNQNNTACPAKV